jgi:hypothetical protein
MGQHVALAALLVLSDIQSESTLRNLQFSIAYCTLEISILLWYNEL